MAYTQQEELSAHGQGRVIGIFTMANAGGAAVLGLGMWQFTKWSGITGDWFTAGSWLQMFLIIAAAVVGVVITFRWSGLSILDRLMLFGAYQQRRMARHIMIQPQAAVANSSGQTMTTLYRDGQVMLRPYRPEEV